MPPPHGGGTADVSKMSESDFKQYVLYVFPGEPVCERALSMLTDEVILQDVTKLPRLPPFVDGVPILADKKNETLARGSACLEALKQLKDSELIPAPAASGFAATTGALRGRSFESAEMLTMPFSAALDEGEYAPAIGDDKVDETSVTEYMQLRDKVTNAIVEEKKQERGGAPGGAPPTEDPKAEL